MQHRVPGVLAILTLAVALGGLAPAQAQDAQGQATATIPVTPNVRSVTLSTNAVTYGNCDRGGASLSFPNDTCRAPAITVTQTGTGRIKVRGSDAVPSDNGTPWTLTPHVPGSDQFYEELNTGGHEMFPRTVLSNSDRCDSFFGEVGADGACPVTTNQSRHEFPYLMGPSSSTSTATSFTTAIIWTAAP